MRQAESFIFSDLAQYRFNPNREFFKVDDEIIKTSFDKIEGEYIDISTFNKNYIRESVKSEQTNIDDNNNNIVEFKCKRCGYETEYKHCMQSHFKRKIICEAKYEDISFEILLIEINIKNEVDKTYDCEYCNKKFSKCSNKSRHKNICKFKPISSDEKVNELTKIVKGLQNKLEKLEDSTSSINNT
jgi:hypothetical protein